MLEPVVKADHCAQYVDDIGTAANNDTDLTRNIRAVFQYIRQGGLKFTIEKCRFGIRQIEFRGRTPSSEGVSPQTQEIQKFPKQIEIPQIEKFLQRYVVLVKYYKKFISRMAEKFKPILHNFES